MCLFRTFQALIFSRLLTSSFLGYATLLMLNVGSLFVNVVCQSFSQPDEMDLRPFGQSNASQTDIVLKTIIQCGLSKGSCCVPSDFVSVSHQSKTFSRTNETLEMIRFHTSVFSRPPWLLLRFIVVDSFLWVKVVFGMRFEKQLFLLCFCCSCRFRCVLVYLCNSSSWCE